MKRTTLFLSLFLIIASLFLNACGGPAPEEERASPVSLEPIPGTDLNRITLTEKAAERLGVETVPVHAQQVNGIERMVVPYAALLYDPSGQAWVYVNVEPLVFVREPITVASINGDEAILSKGPEAGAAVVTLGATELFGSESEFEEE